jgi:hypothetical protein
MHILPVTNCAGYERNGSWPSRELPVGPARASGGGEWRNLVVGSLESPFEKQSPSHPVQERAEAGEIGGCELTIAMREKSS